MKLTYSQLTQNVALLASVAEGRYPHGLDLRPLARAIHARQIGIAVDNRGELVIRLTAAGRETLDNGSAMIQCGPKPPPSGLQTPHATAGNSTPSTESSSDPGANTPHSTVSQSKDST